MIWRPLKFVLMLMIAVAPVAHDLCRLSCESPAPAHVAVASQPATNAHAHCAVARNDRSGDTPSIERAAAVCQSPIDSSLVTAATAKTVVHPLIAVATPAIDVAQPAVSIASTVSRNDRATVPLPSRTQLRV